MSIPELRNWRLWQFQSLLMFSRQEMTISFMLLCVCSLNYLLRRFVCLILGLYISGIVLICLLDLKSFFNCLGCIYSLKFRTVPCVLCTKNDVSMHCSITTQRLFVYSEAVWLGPFISIFIILNIHLNDD